MQTSRKDNFKELTAEDIAAEHPLELTRRGDVTAPPPRGLVPN